MKQFRCPFRKCKYKSDSLLNVFKHLERTHKLEYTKLEGKAND